jgi:hypothetical protein
VGVLLLLLLLFFLFLLLFGLLGPLLRLVGALSSSRLLGGRGDGARRGRGSGGVGGTGPADVGTGGDVVYTVNNMSAAALPAEGPALPCVVITTLGTSLPLYIPD